MTLWHDTMHSLEESIEMFAPNLMAFTLIFALTVALTVAVYLGMRFLVGQSHIRRHWVDLVAMLAGLSMFVFGFLMAMGAAGVREVWHALAVLGVFSIAIGRSVGPVLATLSNYVLLKVNDMLDTNHDVALRYGGALYQGRILEVGFAWIELRPYDDFSGENARDPTVPREGTDQLNRRFADETLFVPTAVVLSMVIRVRWKYRRGEPLVDETRHSDAEQPPQFASSSAAFSALIGGAIAPQQAQLQLLREPQQQLDFSFLSKTD